MVVLNIDQPTYTALRLIQDSIDFMSKDPVKYSITLKKEKALYKYIINEIYENCT